MVASVLWLGTYLLLGAAALWACYNTTSCLVRARAERNGRILAALGLPAGSSVRSASRYPATAGTAARR
jgi:hypothetical protein